MVRSRLAAGRRGGGVVARPPPLKRGGGGGGGRHPYRVHCFGHFGGPGTPVLAISRQKDPEPGEPRLLAISSLEAESWSSLELSF